MDPIPTLGAGRSLIRVSSGSWTSIIANFSIWQKLSEISDIPITIESLQSKLPSSSEVPDPVSSMAVVPFTFNPPISSSYAFVSLGDPEFQSLASMLSSPRLNLHNHAHVLQLLAFEIEELAKHSRDNLNSIWEFAMFYNQWL
ncbi:unnamed protein product [Dovyalis caffra]|uniref:Uncharacterized protein n=1 Tax=Dovyalis caffra TaxID=77055 RepID=A0AAV1SE66_9ROSI|nr:unnamed protein product [Dovyalis caffra]